MAPPLIINKNMETEQRQELWTKFEEEFKSFYSTSKQNNQILKVLNGEEGPRFPIELDSLPKS